MSFVQSFFRQKKQLSPRLTKRRDLIRHEARIGSRLFEKTIDGRERTFFCLDLLTWVWHEEWRDELNKYHNIFTRYELRGDKIVKVRTGSEENTEILDGQELRNFTDAVREYYVQIADSVYNRPIA